MRQLDYSPAADDLAAVVSVYHDDMVAHGLVEDEIDVARLDDAIEKCGREMERFPAPVHIIDQLLPRKYYEPEPERPVLATIPPPTPTSPEDNAEFLRALQKMIRNSRVLVND